MEFTQQDGQNQGFMFQFAHYRCKRAEDEVEEKFGEQNFRVLSEMREKILVYRP